MQLVPLSEILELYVDHEMSMAQVAEHLGVTKQAISYRLKSAGIRARPAGGRKHQEFEKAMLEKLYFLEGLTVTQIAERLNSTRGKVLGAMKAHGIERRRGAGYWRIRELKVGESVDMPRKAWTNPAMQFYGIAENAGIRVSTRTISPETMRVTRVE